MKRTLNPTGKKRLTQDQVWAEITPSPAGKTVVIEWDLTTLQLNPDLEMIAELFASESFREVVPSGWSSKGSHAIELGKTLFEGVIRLSVRLVDSGDPLRRIYASTSSIFLNTDSNSSKSLLKTQPKSDLPTLWAVDFAFGEPVLQILNVENSYRELTSNLLFLSAVLPSAVEKIVELVISEEDSFDAPALVAWEEFLALFGLAQDELQDLRSGLSDSPSAELIYSIRERARAVANSYSSSFKLTDITFQDEEA
jgi:hypothetical protein